MSSAFSLLAAGTGSGVRCCLADPFFQENHFEFASWAVASASLARVEAGE